MMMQNQPLSFKKIITVPFLKGRSFLYISARENHLLDRYIERHAYAILRSMPYGWSFIYIPFSVSDGFGEETLKYLYPGMSSHSVARSFYSYIQGILPSDLKGKSGFLYTEMGKTVLQPFQGRNEDEIEVGINAFLNKFKEIPSYGMDSGEVRFRVTSRKEPEDIVLSESICSYSAPPILEFPQMAESKPKGKTILEGEPCEASVPMEDEDTDEQRFERIRKEMEDFARRHGMTIPELISLFPTKKGNASKVLIDKNYRIILTDYDMEIKMDPLSKAVWLLYLLHSEGIRQKAMIDHYNELLRLYSKFCTRGDNSTMKKSIDMLTDPNNNSLNEKISKANRAFKSALRDDVSDYYCIKGQAAQERRIELDRSLVKWAV